MNAKKMGFVSLISFATLAAAVLISTSKENALSLRAEECTHSHVEHYEATPNHIEHWACCECHHAWADEGKTIEVSENTTTDRDILDTDNYYHAAYQMADDNWEWSGAMNAVYDSTFSFLQKASLPSSKLCFIETNSTDTTIDADKIAAVKITNNTDVTLKVTPSSREWNPYPNYVFNLPAGESAIASIPAAAWNDNTGDRASTGFTLRLDPVGSSTFVGDVLVTTPRFGLNYYNTSYNYVSDWVWDGPMGVSLETSEAYQLAHYEGVVEGFVQTNAKDITVPDGHAYKVTVINNTDAILDTYVRDREWSTNYNHYTINVGEKKIITITSDAINHAGSHGFTGFSIRFGATSITGDILVSAPVDEYYTRFESSVSSEEKFIENIGFAYEIDATGTTSYPNIYFRGREYLDPSLYQGIMIYFYNSGNSSSCAAWSEDWNDHGNGLGTLTPNTWVSAMITVDTWNGDNNSKDVGIYDANIGGKLIVSLGEPVLL